MKITRKIFLFSLLLPLSIGFILISAKGVSADPCSDKSGQDKVDCYQGQVDLLSGQAKTLSNQIAQFNAQIKLTTLKISRTQDQIALLGGRINQLEGSLDALSTAFSSRAVETYKMTRVGDPFFILISAPNLTETISRFHYLQRIENADQDLMTRLQTAQTTYQGQKKTQEELQKELQTEQSALNAQKAAKNALLVQTNNSEKTYQQLRDQAIAELARFANFTGNAPLLDNQTHCDDWGCYYNQRDRQWGTNLINGSNDCNGPCNIARVGCLVTSVAMVASHMGHRDILPSDIASSGPGNFSVGTALLNRGTINVKGVNITRSPAGGSLSPDLVSGGPVIVGINYGSFGTHFVVIKSYSNGTYIMNDPFIENGHDVSFTDHYSIGSIFEIDRVSI